MNTYSDACAKQRVIECHECGNIVQVPQLQHRQKAKCPRCGFILTQLNYQAVDRMIAFASAALLFLSLSLPFTFLGFSANGQQQTIDIIQGLAVLIDEDYFFLAVIQFLAIVALPMLVMLALLYLLIPYRLGTTAIKSGFFLKWIYRLIPWCMAEIFLVGVLVSLIKISSLADVSLGMSFYAYIGFTLCMTATLLHMDKHTLFDVIAQEKLHHPPVNRSLSIQQTWAYLITSILLYIPANLLPIMTTRFLGSDDPSTIMGGVIVLWQMESYPIAMIIFFASIIVPVGKLLILIWLNYSVQVGTQFKQEERIFWYRVTEFIGRWSMIDVFVVAVLVSLIQLGNTMSVIPGPAALAFCAVVILTMLAAMSFDTRLIWQNTEV